MIHLSAALAALSAVVAVSARSESDRSQQQILSQADEQQHAGFPSSIGAPCDVLTQQRLIVAYSAAMFACDVPVDGAAGISTQPVRFSQGGSTAHNAHGFGAGLSFVNWAKSHACSSGCKDTILKPIDLQPDDLGCIGEFCVASIRPNPATMPTNTVALN